MGARQLDGLWDTSKLPHSISGQKEKEGLCGPWLINNPLWTPTAACVKMRASRSLGTRLLKQHTLCASVSPSTLRGCWFGFGLRVVCIPGWPLTC